MSAKIIPLENIPFGHVITASGKIIDILNPDPSLISINDIASALSKKCRFGGGINYFYSIAQHSCLVSWLCGPEMAMAGLMHDAAKAYCDDLIKPRKVTLGAKFEAVEENFLQTIFIRFNIDFDLYPRISEYDQEAVISEYHALYYNNAVFQKQIEFFSAVHTEYKSPTWWWDYRYAYSAFIQTYEALRKIKKPKNQPCYEN